MTLWKYYLFSLLMISFSLLLSWLVITSNRQEIIHISASLFYILKSFYSCDQWLIFGTISMGVCVYVYNVKVKIFAWKMQKKHNDNNLLLLL